MRSQQSGRRRPLTAVLATLWGVVALWLLLRALWRFGLLPVAAVRWATEVRGSDGLILVVVLAITVTVIRFWSRRRWYVVLLVVLALGIAVLRLYRWSETGPEDTWHNHRAEFASISRLAPGADSADYYGEPLPAELAYLSANRNFVRRDEVIFVPYTIGIPDDATGYLYAGNTPIGFDMFGQECTRPIQLGDGWWFCRY